MAGAACALALLLAMDVSSSVTTEEYALQSAGVAQALEAPPVVAALRLNYPLAFSVIQWASYHHESVPWVIIRNDDDLHELVLRLRTLPRSMTGETFMDQAMQSAIKAFETVPCEPERMVIDVSGDGKDSRDLGISDDGDKHAPRHSSVPQMIAKAEEMGIQVNGLPILNPHESIDQDVVEYYQERVHTIGGFVVQADGFEDFANAMRKKLVFEVSGLLPFPRG